jgi:teichuronic acid biosynthesis glycosyltransferase TuaG
MVSVLVTVYNKGAFVRQTLESVVAQSYQNWEMIVVDDNSFDNSREEIGNVRDERIKTICKTRNCGLPSVLRNELSRMARGKYIAFLDGDDVWMQEKLAKQVKFMESHSEYPLSHVACMVVDEQGRDLYLRNWGHYPPDGDCFLELMKKCFICTSAVMVTKDFFMEIGGFSEDPALQNNSEDREFFLRCAKEHRIGMPGTEPLVKYRWLTTSLSHHPTHWKPGLDLLVRRDLWDGRMTEREVRELVWGKWSDDAYLYRRNQNWEAVRWYGREMVKLFPWRKNGWKQWLAGVLRKG